MLPHKKYRNSLTDANVMKLRFSFVCLLFFSSNVEQDEDSLFKRNFFRCNIMKFIANHLIIERLFG